MMIPMISLVPLINARIFELSSKQNNNRPVLYLQTEKNISRSPIIKTHHGVPCDDKTCKDTTKELIPCADKTCKPSVREECNIVMKDLDMKPVSIVIEGEIERKDLHPTIDELACKVNEDLMSLEEEIYKKDCELEEDLNEMKEEVSEELKESKMRLLQLFQEFVEAVNNQTEEAAMEIIKKIEKVTIIRKEEKVESFEQLRDKIMEYIMVVKSSLEATKQISIKRKFYLDPFAERGLCTKAALFEPFTESNLSEISKRENRLFNNPDDISSDESSSESSMANTGEFFEDSLKDSYGELFNNLETSKDSDTSEETLETIDNVSSDKKDGVNEGTKDGVKDGVNKGMNKGVNKGMNKGRKDGMNKGRKDGVNEGMSKDNSLPKRKRSSDYPSSRRSRSQGDTEEDTTLHATITTEDWD